jgi:hypothetical protein
MALVKYNNNSISAVSSAASIPSGAMTHIKTLTASSSSTLSFVHGSSDVVLDSTYPIYLFKFINIHPATDNALLTFQGSTNTGSSYGVTITSTVHYAYHDEADSATTLAYSSDDLAQSTNFFKFVGGTGNGNDESSSGYLHLFNPSSTTFVKHFMSRNNYYYGGNYSIERNTGGYFNTTSAIDAIQFKYSSGNIDSGSIKLYGIKDS